MSKNKHAAFTLVELLVVISIIGILVALISAATVAAIRSANQAVAMNNEKEIWQAMQIYESRKNRYPGYASYPVPSMTTRQASWLVPILPHLGYNDIYDIWIDPNSTAAQLQATYVGIPILVSPGDDQVTPSGPWLGYVVNTGIPDSLSGSGGVQETKAHGIFFNHRLPVATRITCNSSDIMNNDGMANTLALAENRRADTWMGYASGGTVPQEYLLGFNWENVTSNVSWLVYPVNQRDTSQSVPTFLVDTAIDSSGARINGPHPGVAIVMFADGHAIKLSEDIDHTVYNKLCTPNGTKLPHSSWPVQGPLDTAEYIK